MERSETTVCEKLFNAFHSSLHPLRRLTFRQQADHTLAGPPDNSLLSDHCPPPPPPAPKPKTPVPNITTTKGDIVPPQTLRPPALAPAPKERVQQLPNALSKVGSNPTPVSIPTPTAPDGAPSAGGGARGSRPADTTPVPTVPAWQKTATVVPQPAPPPGAEKVRRSVNEKAEDYIARARNKIRSGTGIGRTPTSK